MSQLESEFQSKFRKELEALFPGCIVFKTNANMIQGFPDLMMIWNDRWAAFELKRSGSASKRVNQEYYIDKLDDWSFAAFVNPENVWEVLDDLQGAFED